MFFKTMKFRLFSLERVTYQFIYCAIIFFMIYFSENLFVQNYVIFTISK